MGTVLWIHGKRAWLALLPFILLVEPNRSLDVVAGSGKSVLSYVSPFHVFSVLILGARSSIIQEVKLKCDRGLALMGYFYFDFKDIAKQGIRGLLASLIAQFCAKSDPCHQILSNLYSENHAGSQQPNNDALKKCLNAMLRLSQQPTIYIIVDAIDECPNTSGIPTAREEVLEFLEELIDLKLPNVRMCVISRPRLTFNPFLNLSHSPVCPFTTKLAKNKISYITLMLSFTRTGECGIGGRRTSNWSLIPSLRRHRGCE